MRGHPSLLLLYMALTTCLDTSPSEETDQVLPLPGVQDPAPSSFRPRNLDSQPLLLPPGPHCFPSPYDSSPRDPPFFCPSCLWVQKSSWVPQRPRAS
ncbi:proline rich and Gla domain 2 [Homo sapiens]|uniref:Proline rich and Gla domain 2 n=1 Tax=Homo sapiens TaxID=9606 RepID=M0QZA1_HUMAN|nr:proline rich and Gla domain 2 [Homo sapiens]KAI4043963.1 proline rich and Gla domain 2 [Homo sapiens]